MFLFLCLLSSLFIVFVVVVVVADALLLAVVAFAASRLLSFGASLSLSRFLALSFYCGFSVCYFCSCVVLAAVVVVVVVVVVLFLFLFCASNRNLKNEQVI